MHLWMNDEAFSHAASTVVLVVPIAFYSILTIELCSTVLAMLSNNNLHEYVVVTYLQLQLRYIYLRIEKNAILGSCHVQKQGQITKRNSSILL